MRGWMRAWVWAWAWAWVVLLVTPCNALVMRQQEEQQEPGIRHMLEALNRVSEALETHDRHTSLYERVALLESSLAEKTEREMVLEAEVTQLRAKIPELEAEIKTIPEMRKELAEFEANIEKLVQDYEVKLSTLASEVIRLKKSGARRKDLLTLSDGSDVLLHQVPSCPEIGQDMVAERVGEHCLYFSLGERQNWTASYDRCHQLGAQMAASQVLQPLKQFLLHAFARGPSLWLGSSFNLFQDEPQNEDDEEEDTGAAVKAPGGDSESSSIHAGQDLSNTFQADGVIGHPEGGANPFALNLKAIPVEDIDEEFPGRSGSLRAAFDRATMFHDELLGSYGNHFLADEPTERAPIPEERVERAPDTSVVDIVLLTGPDADEGLQGTKPRVPANLTEERGREAALGEGGNMEEAIGRKDSHKTRMKCMLLQQSEALEYELVARPCNEEHSFVCDLKVTIDSLLPES
ncbi:LOW QUALITY PROTEIN: uncharacterized protein LOC123508974 [Portunus trituberculatus]|uniref:LOW QUALITY PROTEIN: uncharacterized protein LOC123508974 n=1 Tax=Portunus trituberculatus TaxID=210409 RepID=UPI001E1CC3F4|nr:LOW QUALITY PROTEIN: uncharacterized protein LOC123508974 [Portunus trituberculatus]